MSTIFIPADVPQDLHQEFRQNYAALTKDTDKLFLLAADHKIEHLDADFIGAEIDLAAHDPIHLFNIASKSPVGALATQLGLIARYGKQFPQINYVIKLNSKTNVIPRAARDPFSKLLWTIDDVLTFKESSQLLIRGIGLTVYLGSEFEDKMLAQAAQALFQAHQNGLVALVWIYPRGKYVKCERDPRILAGAAGVAACLGADFVKLNPPQDTKEATSAEHLKIIVQAAGNTKVLCAGGEPKDQEILLKNLSDQLTIGGTSGAAIGRNIYQHSLPEAFKLSKKIADIIYKTT